MNTMELVHFVSTGERPAPRSIRTSTPRFFSELIRPARQAILRARQFLLNEQRSDGSWLAIQKADASLASRLVLMLAYFGREESALAEQAVATILHQQLPEGGWPLVPGGRADLSTSVQAYFALKLSGMDAGDGRLSRAREAIRSLGGADAADMSTRLFLALLGQVEFDRCAPIRPEVLLPNHQNACRVAALAAIWSHRPVRRVEAERGVRELFIGHSSDWPIPSQGVRSTPVPIVGPILRIFERFGWTPLRTRALDRIERQLLHNIAAPQIGQLDFCELVWHAIAIHALGYQDDSPQRQMCEYRLREMVDICDDSQLASPQIRSAPVTDTIAGLRSLGASGMGVTHPTIAAAVKWLSRRRHSGPAALAADLAGLIELLDADTDCPDDCHDALPPAIDLGRRHATVHRGYGHKQHSRIGRVAASLVERLLHEQNDDGGWANFGAASVPDVTGAVLESLQLHRNESVAAAARRAVGYLRRTQRPDGSWDSAHGVRLIHGTSLAVRGMLAAGISCDDEAVAAGINWLLVHQQPSGGWGELPSRPANEATSDYEHAHATASQTAWALLALVATGRSNAVAVRRGIEFLLETQQEDGQWHEPQFVLRDPSADRWFHSDVHAAAGPLLALSRWAVTAAIEQSNSCHQVSLRLVGAAD